MRVKPSSLTISEIAEVLERNGGHISNAAAELNVERTGLQRRIKKSPRLQEAINEGKVLIADEAMKSALALVQAQDPMMTKFVLSRVNANLDPDWRAPYERAKIDAMRVIINEEQDAETALTQLREIFGEKR